MGREATKSRPRHNDAHSDNKTPSHLQEIHSPKEEEKKQKNSDTQEEENSNEEKDKTKQTEGENEKKL